MAEFEESGLQRLVKKAPSDAKRIVVDSDDVLGASAARILDATRSHRAAKNDGSWERAAEVVRAVDTWLAAIDSVTGKLARELARQYDGYSTFNLDYQSGIVKSLDRFGRLALWQIVAQFFRFSDALEIPSIAAAANLRHEISRGDQHDFERAFASWALGERASDGCSEFFRADAAGPNVLSMRWYLPKTAFQETYWDFRDRVSVPAELSQGDWLDLILPQVALHAVHHLARSPSSHRVQSEIGWNLDDYTSVYLSQ